VSSADLTRKILLPFSWLYGLAVKARNLAYDRGWFRQESVGVPVLSVGNLTAGGTGKTPLVEYLVRCLIATGKHPAVISRGYGRRSSGVVVVSDGKVVQADAALGGDEPVQIARKLGTVPVIVAEKRSVAARVAVRDLHADVLVLDDGFQHRSLKRDLNILVIDARKDLTREPLLPAGLRREPLSAIQRAGLVVLSKVDPDAGPVRWLDALSEYLPGSPVTSGVVPAGIYRLADGKDVGTPELLKDPVLAFSGIADHAGFLRTVQSFGMTISDDVRFPDHHRFDRRDMLRLRDALRASGAALFLTTEKDAMRLEAEPQLKDLLLEAAPAYVARIQVEILSGEDRLHAAVDACARGGTR
jgi:tetraacyldisaccharide 4'-kinase